jgi:hypothetical protein
MNAPEIVDWLDEFDLDVSFDARKIPSTHNAARDFTSLRV